MNRTNPNDDLPTSFFKLRWNQACFFCKLNHLERPASPLLNDAALVEDVGDQVIAKLRGMRPGQFFDRDPRRKGARWSIVSPFELA